MRPNLRTMALAGVVSLGGLLGAGASDAKAQLFIGTPGFALGVGAPVGVYPAYGVYPGYMPAYGAYPVRPYPYPYAYARPGYYGPRAYGPYYGPRYGYRRW